MAKAKDRTPRLEGEELQLHLGHEAITRLNNPMKAAIDDCKRQEGLHTCGFRFQEGVYVGTSEWNREGTKKVNIRLKVFSLHPQTEELVTVIDHIFEEEM